MNDLSEDTKPSLPPVEAARAPRSYKRAPTHYPYSLVETVRYYTGTDRDLIWGPFYRRFRAARRERTNWVGLSLGAIWDGIPAASQTRPGKIARVLHWATGADPPPTVKRAPALRSTNPAPDSAAAEPWQHDDTRVRDDWSPAQIDFAAWHGRHKHPADYDNDFYRETYGALYAALCRFGETWFGAGVWLEDLRDAADADVSAWEVPMTDQFVQYARAAAHEDRGYVNWKDVLNDPQHRKWLCVGVFAQIIERRIFNQLLFGAGKQYQDELDRHDSRWLLEEGFTRKDGRRQIARAALGEGLVPEDFWDAVDDLAGQTVLVFQPLFTLLCLGTGRTGSRDGARFWQEAHTIIAMAGYFQVCMAVSPSVFHVLSATPGARYQWEEEAHADHAVYEAAKAFRRSHEDRWRALAELSARGENARVTQLVTAAAEEEGGGGRSGGGSTGGSGSGSGGVDPADEALYMPLPTTDDEFRLMDHQRRRGGKVMYAVFPKLTRYRAENVGEPIVDVRQQRRRGRGGEAFTGALRRRHSHRGRGRGRSRRSRSSGNNNNNNNNNDDDDDNKEDDDSSTGDPRLSSHFNLEDDSDDADEGEGMRISVLSRCMVVYYQGLVHAGPDEDDGVPLEAHLNEIAWRRMPGGVLPYVRRAWGPAGDPVARLHWPLWPDAVDGFWVAWLLCLAASLALRWWGGSGDGDGSGSGSGGGGGDSSVLYAALLLLLRRPIPWLLADAAVYLGARAAGLGLFEGPYRFWRLHGFNFAFLVGAEVLARLYGSGIGGAGGQHHHHQQQQLQLFGYLASPLLWLDDVFLGALPAYLLAFAGALKVRDTSGLIDRAASLFAAAHNAANGTVVGRP